MRITGAVLRASKTPNTPFLENRMPAPLKISKTPLKIGDKVYTIGFPSVLSRICAGHLPIKNQNSIYKRGSEGIYVGRFKPDDNADANMHTWIGTTIRLAVLSDTLFASALKPLVSGVSLLQ